MRDVETASEEIARRRGNEDYWIPISRLSDFETKGVIPSIYRMYSLSVIYRMDSEKMFSLYDVPFDSGKSNEQNLTPDMVQAQLQSGHDRKASPPLAGRYVLDLLLPRKHRENLIGDIEQDYRTNILQRYGRTAASIWFWKQVLSEIIPGLYLRLVTTFVKHFFSRFT